MAKSRQQEIDKLHEEILKEVHQVEEEETKAFSLIKKVLFVFIGITLIYLTISFVLPSPRVLAILFSQWDSFEINNNSLTLPNNNKIQFHNQTYDTLRNIYFRNQEHEFKACLQGYRTADKYIITNIELPEIISQDLRSVTAKPCPRNTIIDLHSHPVKSCHFSLHDLNVYDRIRNQNPNNLIAIMCEHNRFNVYGFN